MNDAPLVGTILHLTGFGILDCDRHFHGHGAHFRVRHQAARAKNLPQLTNDTHRVRRRDNHVEIDVARLDFSRQIIKTNDIGTRRFGRFSLVALGKDGNTHALASTRRQDNGTTNNLIRLARVNPQADSNVDRFVKLGRCALLGQLQRISQGISFAAIDLALQRFLFFRQRSHLKLPPP